MKKYLMLKTVEAEPMLQSEAEAKLGREVGHDKNALGYLICDTKTLQWDWLSEFRFDGLLFETDIDKLQVLLRKTDEWRLFIIKFLKNNQRLTPDQRRTLYQANRHLKGVNDALSKFLSSNIINTIEL